MVWPCFRGSWFENNLIYSDIAFTQLLDFLANFLVLRRNFLKKANTFLRILIISSWKRVSLTLYFNKLDLQDTGLEIISKVNRTRALFLFVTLIKYTFKRLFNFFPAWFSLTTVYYTLLFWNHVNFYTKISRQCEICLSYNMTRRENTFDLLYIKNLENKICF